MDIDDVEPIFETFDGTELEAIEFVWSENVHRRDLDSGQRAAVWLRRERLEASYEAKLKQKVEAEARERVTSGKRADGQAGGRGHKKNPPQTFGEGFGDDSDSMIATQPLVKIPAFIEEDVHARESAAIRAKAAGTNRQYIADVEEIQAKKPEIPL